VVLRFPAWNYLSASISRTNDDGERPEMQKRQEILSSNVVENDRNLLAIGQVNSVN